MRYTIPNDPHIDDGHTVEVVDAKDHDAALDLLRKSAYALRMLPKCENPDCVACKLKARIEDFL